MSPNLQAMCLGTFVILVILCVILHCPSLIFLISGQQVHLPSLVHIVGLMTFLSCVVGG